MKNDRPLDFEMTNYMPRSADGYRRVEPIFDASGTLKRHAINKSDASRTPAARDKTDAAE